MRPLILCALLFTLPLSSARSIGDDKEDKKVVLDSFKKFTKDNIKDYDKNKREGLSLLGGGWVKERYDAEPDYEIDVKTSDSLVSPYVGTCEFKLRRSHTAFHETKEDAEKDSAFTKTLAPVKHKHTYAYQDGKWVVKTRTHYFDTLGGSWDDCNEVLKAGPEKGKKDLFGCFEPDNTVKPEDKKP